MSPPLILFPHQPFSPREIDADFRGEFEAACSVGFGAAFYDHDAVEAGRLQSVLTKAPGNIADQTAILRGWMLTGEAYASFYDQLAERGYRLATSPAAYAEAHYLPLAYPHIASETARSEWVEGDDVDAAWQMYQSFRDADAMIKDWVKSAKSRWREGCFIPAGSSESQFREIYRVFREERSKLFNRGVVLREFLPLRQHGRDAHGMPHVEETRLFFWNRRVVVRPPSAASEVSLDLPYWEAIACRFQSPFLTIDVASLDDDSYRIIEVGDGGVSGLPASLDPAVFYQRLWDCMTAV